MLGQHVTATCLETNQAQSFNCFKHSLRNFANKGQCTKHLNNHLIHCTWLFHKVYGVSLVLH